MVALRQRCILIIEGYPAMTKYECSKCVYKVIVSMLFFIDGFFQLWMYIVVCAFRAINHFRVRVHWLHRINCATSVMMTSSNGNIFRVTGHLCGEFPAQRPVTRSFDVFFDLRLNKWLSKQPWGWWFETPSHPLWRHCNGDQKLI